MKFEAMLESHGKTATGFEVPDDLAAALAATPEALRFYDTLSFSQQQFYVQPVTQAKQPETRQRRIERAVERLAEGRKP